MFCTADSNACWLRWANPKPNPCSTARAHASVNRNAYTYPRACSNTQPNPDAYTRNTKTTNATRYPPQIVGYDIPEYQRVGTPFEIIVNAKDDKQAKEVSVRIEGLDPILLETNNGLSWKRKGIVRKLSYNKYTIEVTDSGGNQITEDGTIIGKVPGSGN